MKVTEAEEKYLAKATEEPEEYVKWVMEEEDHCPVCHSNMLSLRGNRVKCAICDVRGDIKIVNGKVTVTYDKKGLEQVRSGPVEGARHGSLVRHGMKLYEENKEKIMKITEKYVDYGNLQTPPTLPGQKPVKMFLQDEDRQAMH